MQIAALSLSVKGYARSTKREAELAAAYCALQAPVFSPQTPPEHFRLAPNEVQPSDPPPAAGSDTPVYPGPGVDSPDEEVCVVVSDSSPEQTKSTSSGKINLRSFLASQIQGTPGDSPPVLINRVSEVKENTTCPEIVEEDIISTMPSVDFRRKLSNVVLHYFVVPNSCGIVQYYTSSHIVNKKSYFSSVIHFVPFDMTCKGLMASSKRIAECLAARELLQTDHFVALEECMMANAETVETGRLRPKQFDYKGKLMALLFKALPNCYSIRRNVDLFTTTVCDGSASYVSSCTIKELSLTVQGKYSISKKSAEQSAARAMLFHEAMGPLRRKANIKLEDLPSDDVEDEASEFAFSTPLKVRLYDLLSKLFSPRLLKEYLVYSHTKCAEGYRCQLRIIPLALNVEGDEERTIEGSEASAETIALNTSLLRAFDAYYNPPLA